MADFEIIQSRGELQRIAFIDARIRSALRRSWFSIGVDLRREFRRQVRSGQKTGRIYNIGGKSHQASAEGETAANITGNYAKKINFTARADELVLGNSAEYAGFLESGTSRMRARPGLRNAILATNRNILSNLSEQITEAI